MQKKIIIFFVILLSLCFTVLTVYYYAQQQKEATIFFGTSLTSAHVNETVVVEGKSYHVTDGRVLSSDGEAPGNSEIFPILRTAYALTLARRSPFFVLPGADLNAVEQEVKQLAAAQKKLAALQETPRDAELVTSALYPISYLQSILAAEKARRAFLLSGSDADEEEYDASLTKVLNSFTSDLTTFKKSFESAVAANQQPYMLLSGTVSRDSVLAAISKLESGIGTTRVKINNRRSCLRGTVEACTSSDVSFPTMSETNEETGSAAQKAPELVKNIRSVFANALNDPALLTATVVKIPESSCVKDAPSMYFLALEEPDYQALPIAYIGDMFLYLTADFPDSPVVSFMRDRGISYYPAIVTAYYQCEDAGRDIDRIYGTLLVADFAKTHSSLAPDAARKLSSEELIRREDAETYVREALEKIAGDRNASKEILGDLTELSLTLNSAGAGFNRLLAEITTIENDNVRMKNAGVPVETDAPYLFFVRSAFLSLFLANDFSVGGGDSFSLRQDSDVQDLFRSLKRWSDIRRFTSQEKIASDIGFFLKMHQSPEVISN